MGKKPDETWDADDLLEWCDHKDYGAAHADRLRQVIEVARTRGDDDLQFAAQLRTVANAVFTDHREQAIPAFAWMLSKHREDAARYSGDGDQSSFDFFWQFKWMPDCLAGSPEVSREQIESMLDDFEATFRVAGLGMSAPTTARFETAIKAGNLDEAQRLDAELTRLGRDEYSSCEACVASNSIDLAILRGEHERAAEMVSSMWESGLTCGDEPARALGSALVSLALTGRTDTAARAFEQAYEFALAGDAAPMLTVIADCVAFAAVTGNEERSLSMLERHLSGFAQSTLQDDANLKVLRAVAVALSRLERKGCGDALVRGLDDPGSGGAMEHLGGRRTVAELAEASWDAADRLAAAFDARNGNDFRARWMADARAMVTAELPVDLGESGLAPVVMLPTPPSDAQGPSVRVGDAVWIGRDVRTDPATTAALLRSTLRREKSRGADHETLATTLFDLARAYALTEDDRCGKTYLKAARHSRKAGNVLHAGIATCAAASEFVRQGDVSGAIVAARAAIADGEEAGDGGLVGRAQVLLGRELYAMRDGGWDAAVTRGIAALDAAGLEQERDDAEAVLVEMRAGVAGAEGPAEAQIDEADVLAAVESDLAWGDWEDALERLLEVAQDDHDGDATVRIALSIVDHRQAPHEAKIRAARLTAARLVERGRLKDASEWTARLDAME